MKTFLLLGISLVALGSFHARADETPRTPAQERIELAKRIYRQRILSGLEICLSPPRSTHPGENPLFNETIAEDLHRWSLRWMEAEYDAATDRAGRVAAAKAHVDRMIAVESGKMIRKELADHPLVKDLDEQKSPLVEIDANEMRKFDDPSVRRFIDITCYFRLEAEALLEKEKDLAGK